MTRLAHKVKLVMVIGNAHVNMVIQGKSAVYVQLGFTRNGMVVNIYAQVSVLTFLDLLQLTPNLLYRSGINFFENSRNVWKLFRYVYVSMKNKCCT